MFNCNSWFNQFIHRVDGKLQPANQATVDTPAACLHTAPVFIRWSKWFIVLALVIVTGGHWVLLQSAAWVGMAVNYSQSDPVSVALEKTFDGKHPCQLCKLVKKGKAAEQKHNFQKLEIKFEFLSVAGTCGLFPPRPFRHFTPQPQCAAVLPHAPPLPPPRAA